MIDLMVGWAYRKLHPCAFGERVFIDTYWLGLAWNTRMPEWLAKLHVAAYFDMRYGN